MKDFRSLSRPALSLLCLVSLAACGGGANSDSTPSADGNAHHRARAGSQAGPTADFSANPTDDCPSVAVLQQAQTVTLFVPGHTDIANQLSVAQITGVAGSCDFKSKKNALLVSFTAQFLADNGPANNGQPITLPWFVAITEGDRIIQENHYTITLNFNGNTSTTAASSKPVKIEVPVIPQAANVAILAGIDMTPDQLAYSAAHPGAQP